MKLRVLHYKYLAAISVPFTLSCALPSAAHAALSDYNAVAILTFSLSSISNLSNPGNNVGLNVEAGFLQAGPPDSFSYTFGDGSVNANNPSQGPVPLSIGDTFTYSFSVSGEANNGTVDAAHLGQFALRVINQGSDTFDVGVTLNYQLIANANGQNAAASAGLDYFDDDFSFTGSDGVFAQSNVNSQDAVLGSTGLYRFTVAGLESKGLYADATIAGNLQATAVPVPAAFWFLSSTLAALGCLSQRDNKPKTRPT